MHDKPRPPFTQPWLAPLLTRCFQGRTLKDTRLSDRDELNTHTIKVKTVMRRETKKDKKCFFVLLA